MAASIRVYGWRKPTIAVELVEGGSLLPNTKYYIVGAYGFTAYTYIGYTSPVSDVHEITTTTTALSIKITQTTPRTIQSFADNGDGRTLVNCDRHCLQTVTYPDTIKIDTGDYAGTHIIEDNGGDYHSFIIDVAYVSATGVECYTDSAMYNRPTSGGVWNSAGMVYWVHTTHPNPTGTSWSNASYWTKYPWYTTMLENPLTVTTQPTLRFATYSVSPQLSNMNNGTARALWDYGNVLVQWEGGAGTLEDVYDEVQASGFVYNCGYGLVGNGRKPYFELAGALRANSDASFTQTGTGVTLWGEFDQNTYPENFVFNNCSITFPMSLFTAYCNFTANDCAIFNNATANTLANWIYGDNSLQYISPRTGFDYDADYYDNFTAATISCGMIDTKTFKDVGSNMYYQFAYNSRRIKNSTTIPLYWVMRQDGAQPEDGVFMVDNVIINEVDSYNWGIRFYSYDPLTTRYIQNFRNVDNYTEDGVLRDRVHLVHSSVVDGEFHFWRTASFTVQHEGTLLGGANVLIDDGVGHTYSGVTNVNGVFSVDVLEQTTDWDETVAANSNHDPQYDTLYENFTVTISKEGYESEELYVEKFQVTPNFIVEMKKIVPVMVGTDGRSAVKVNPKNIGANRDKIIIT